MQPSRTKFRKFTKVIPSGLASSGDDLAFGTYGIKSLEAARITGKHIETVRRILAKSIKKTGRVNIRIFPHLPVTNKPADVRMGGGKGNVEYYIANIKAGTVMFEMDGITESEARILCVKVSNKLPVACLFVKRRFSAIN